MAEYPAIQSQDQTQNCYDKVQPVTHRLMIDSPLEIVHNQVDSLPLKHHVGGFEPLKVEAISPSKEAEHKYFYTNGFKSKSHSVYFKFKDSIILRFWTYSQNPY